MVGVPRGHNARPPRARRPAMPIVDEPRQGRIGVGMCASPALNKVDVVALGLSEVGQDTAPAP